MVLGRYVSSNIILFLLLLAGETFFCNISITNIKLNTREEQLMLSCKHSTEPMETKLIKSDNEN